MHYDGARWMAEKSGTAQNLRASWTAPTGEVFVAGDVANLLRRTPKP
jgi:hypothetical protein